MSQAVCFFIVSAVGTAVSANSLGKMLGYFDTRSRVWWVITGVVAVLTVVNLCCLLYWGLQLG